MVPDMPIAVNDAILLATEATDPEPVESLVEELAGDTILVRWPALSGGTLPVSVGQLLTVRYSRDCQEMEFEATVEEMIEGLPPLLRIRPAGPPRRPQRRNDCRVAVFAHVDLRMKVVGLKDFKDSHPETYGFTAEATNISAGGFSITLKQRVPVGTLFEARLTLPGDRDPPLVANARVIRCNPVRCAAGFAGEFEVGFAFSRIPESARQRIVRFVFGAQRETRFKD
jgi:c-di-GMP-binding flagellar brake protein YcgR